MAKQFITSSFYKVSPQIEREKLWLIIEKLANSNLNNKQIIYIYNILYSIYQILIRYETLCREVALLAEMENDSQKLRNNVYKLSHDALHKDLRVAQISLDNIDV